MSSISSKNTNQSNDSHWTLNPNARIRNDEETRNYSKLIFIFFLSHFSENTCSPGKAAAAFYCIPFPVNMVERYAVWYDAMRRHQWRLLAGMCSWEIQGIFIPRLYFDLCVVVLVPHSWIHSSIHRLVRWQEQNGRDTINESVFIVAVVLLYYVSFRII